MVPHHHKVHGIHLNVIDHPIDSHRLVDSLNLKSEVALKRSPFLCAEGTVSFTSWNPPMLGVSVSRHDMMEVTLRLCDLLKERRLPKIGARPCGKPMLAARTFLCGVLRLHHKWGQRAQKMHMTTIIQSCVDMHDGHPSTVGCRSTCGESTLMWAVMCWLLIPITCQRLVLPCVD